MADTLSAVLKVLCCFLCQSDLLLQYLQWPLDKYLHTAILPVSSSNNTPMVAEVTRKRKYKMALLQSWPEELCFVLLVITCFHLSLLELSVLCFFAEFCCFVIWSVSRNVVRAVLFILFAEHTWPMFTCHWCRETGRRMICPSLLQSTQAKQRKESLQKSVEKAKVGRQDTVRLFYWGYKKKKMHRR